MELIEKRVRKDIRINKLILKNDKLLVLDDGSYCSKLNIFMLKSIIKDPTIIIEIKKIDLFDYAKFNNDIKYNKTIIPWCLDDEIALYLKSMFENKKQIIISDKTISLILGVTKKEIKDFLDIKKIKYKSSKPIDKDIKLFIGNIDNKYPGTRFSILKSIKALR